MEETVKAFANRTNGTRTESTNEDETITIELPYYVKPTKRNSIASGIRKCVTYGYSVVKDGGEFQKSGHCDKRWKGKKMQSLAICGVLLLTAGVWFLADGLPLTERNETDTKVIKKNIVDMSYPYDNTTMYWPEMPKFVLENVWKGTVAPGGTWYQANKFCAAEHGGTHMDAPNHFQEGQWAVNEIPFERFIAPAVVLNITERASRDSDTMVTIDDALAWEKEHGAIPKGAIILMNSGWGQYWNNRTAFFGSENDATKHHFPGFSPELATWLVKNRDIVAIGVDTPSLDVGTSQTFPTHQVCSANNVYGLEMVANLGDIPPSGATLYSMPLKIKDGTGGPTRVFALIP